jgi:hypothetical protein
MEPDTQRDAGPTVDAACQDAKAAKHMSMDVLGFCGIFRFLKELFNPGHPASFLRLLDPVPDQDVEIPFLIEGSVLPDAREPTQAYLI